MADVRSLPYRLVSEAPTEPVLTVDGAFGAPGLELSHWPGNRTPRDLRHRLSTGSALAFAALPAAERARRTAGLTAVANNHYDTDGLCAAWVVLHPERALGLREPLLHTAACGDFFQLPNEAAFARDVLIQACVDRERSPLAEALRGLDDHARRERASAYVLERLGDWLASGLEDAPLADHRECWLPALERLRADLAALDLAEVHSVGALDLTCFRVESAANRPSAPGRHACFGRTARDRVLCSVATDGGWHHRLVVGTRSWFDLDPAEAPPARFDLEAAVERLEALEPARDAHRWRCDSGPHPSPELWFGGPSHAAFEEHHADLAPSRLDPEAVVAALEA
ncbi:MAG: DUF6687 family protein [Planctomycetota bacterium]